MLSNAVSADADQAGRPGHGDDQRPSPRRRRRGGRRGRRRAGGAGKRTSTAAPRRAPRSSIRSCTRVPAAASSRTRACAATGRSPAAGQDAGPSDDRSSTNRCGGVVLRRVVLGHPAQPAGQARAPPARRRASASRRPPSSAATAAPAAASRRAACAMRTPRPADGRRCSRTRSPCRSSVPFSVGSHSSPPARRRIAPDAPRVSPDAGDTVITAMTVRSAFRDRREAGRVLAGSRALPRRDDLWCSVWPAGACRLAGRSRRSRAPLDVFLVRKLGVPQLARAGDGRAGHRRRHGAQRRPDPQPRTSATSRSATRSNGRPPNCTGARQAYRAGRRPRTLAGRTVMLADDGIATGASMLAAVRAVRQSGATADRGRGAGRACVGLPAAARRGRRRGVLDGACPLQSRRRGLRAISIRSATTKCATLLAAPTDELRSCRRRSNRAARSVRRRCRLRGVGVDEVGRRRRVTSARTSSAGSSSKLLPRGSRRRRRRRSPPPPSDRRSTSSRWTGPAAHRRSAAAHR